MALHPQAALAVQRAGELPANLPPLELRRIYLERRLELLPPKPEIALTYDVSIPGRGGAIPGRFYRAHQRMQPCPLLVYFHGGGFMLGNIELYDTSCRRLAIKGDCAVLSVDYRLTPEHRFPAAVEDAYAATLWCSRNAAKLNVDLNALVVGGDSAGGNLSAVVAQMAHDSGEFKVAGQILIYPCTELVEECPSFVRNATGYMLTTAAVRWFYDEYVPQRADRLDPRASPARRKNLRGLPPALIISAEFDPLVDENEAYAKRLKEAGVPTQYHCFKGMLHPFFTLGAVIDAAADAEDLVAAELRKLG